MLPVLLTAIPSLLSAYKTVKEINASPKTVINRHLGDQGKDKLSIDEFNKLTETPDFNLLKREVAITLLKGIETKWFNPYKWFTGKGCNDDDLGVIVDFVCVVYKIIRGKK
jgi:hypothetical protein